MPAPVAVAVVSWNTRALLDEALRALHADHEAGRAEVWVVDNGSTDGSAEHVREQHPWARMVASDENLGFGPAVNRVAASTTTPWLVAANADVAVAPHALRALLAAGAREPRAGCLAPRLRTPDGATQHSVHPFPSVGSELARLFGLAGERLALEGAWDPGRERDVDWVHGAFVLLRRSAFDAVGGFDPAQWLYAEDLDLGWRLRRAGWRTRYVPSAGAVHHIGASTTQAFGEETFARKQAAAYAWQRRRRGEARTRAFAAVAYAGARVQAAREPPGWRRDRALAWAASHRAGWRGD